MSKTYRNEVQRNSSRRNPTLVAAPEIDLELMDYLDDLETDRIEAGTEFFGVRPQLSVDYSIN